MGDYQFLSHSFKQLQTYPVLKSFSIPIPAAYLQALDFGKYKQERFFVTWYDSIWGHKSTKSLSGKRFN
ncbi:hypothetical protein [Microcystis aeruginosa]|uniref:hypothetical protein n=1 Tax=Microcystis aeruginosa TaxID=1126 RepID=UPI0011B6D3AC|nr:hypothetical protein [Microcystis aeruginosa]